MSHSRAYYQAPVAEFLAADDSAILGELARHHSHSLEHQQKGAWVGQISLLKSALKAFKQGHLFLEFAIPRMGKRADGVLFLDGVVYVLEFKVGATSFERSAIDQVVDYALDLSNFHEGSHNRIIYPVLIATRAQQATRPDPQPPTEVGVQPCIRATSANLASTLASIHALVPKNPIDAVTWAQSRYRPTPTIIEAAQALYRNHSVETISRHGADASTSPSPPPASPKSFRRVSVIETSRSALSPESPVPARPSRASTLPAIANESPKTNMPSSFLEMAPWSMS